MSLQKVSKFYSSLVEESLSNYEFKKSLVDNPKETIRKFNKNVIIPEDIDIIVEDQSSSDIIYLNIPKKANIDDLELSEEDLELVAGGVTASLAAATIVTTIGCVVGGVICLGVGVLIGMND